MAEPLDPHDPLEVLAAVRRMEAEVLELRARARRTAEPDLEGLRRAIARDAAEERRRTVEDLGAVIDVVAASWRSTQAQLGQVQAALERSQAEVADLRAALLGARLEVRLGGPNGRPAREANGTAGATASG
jgi:hypothetical protein